MLQSIVPAVRGSPAHLQPQETVTKFCVIIMLWKKKPQSNFTSRISRIGQQLVNWSKQTGLFE